jgi:crotonobetainyl-CoA:carnitine CoA-transferase CaiB-like acyl-CoA transferase
MVVEMETRDGQPVRLLGNPLKMSATPVRFELAPPHVDQDRDDILDELSQIEARRAGPNSEQPRRDE